MFVSSAAKQEKYGNGKAFFECTTIGKLKLFLTPTVYHQMTQVIQDVQRCGGSGEMVRRGVVRWLEEEW